METKEGRKVVTIPDLITVRQLAELLGVSPIEVIKELIADGIMANINQTIDYDTAAVVASDIGFDPREEAPPPLPEVEAPPAPLTEVPLREIYAQEEPEDLEPRSPVVTVMGHVDHGKTTLLDAIRQTNVVDSEVGGITQHIGAYQVEKKGRKITFIDTPGHEAFTAMRARGAQVTDMAVLVVAADDWVMPQTKEAIDHARAARVPMIVAINKIDKKDADQARVKRQLGELGLTVEEQGGEVICVPVSAREKKGLDALLEMILLVADLSELRANPHRAALGTVIEGKLDRSRGPMATVLVQNGTLKVGDNLVVGSIYGRVRAMFDYQGEPVKKATPSTPVAILGLSDVPRAGDTFEVVPDEKGAKSLAQERAEKEVVAGRRLPRLTLDEIYAQIQAGKVKELLVILKGDVQGSLEPVRNSLQRLGDEKIRVRIIQEGTGNITESDVNLAIASGAIIIGFNVQADPTPRSMAEMEGVEIRQYEVIYKLIEDVEKALQGLLEPVYEDVVLGRAKVRAVFHISKRGKVAGVYVEEGEIRRNAQAKVIRDGEVVYDGQIASLKRFKDDVKEVAAGFECGIGLDGFEDLEEGDIIEVYKKERVG
ncbi:MAG: translation initiation factor IF-2 [Anaerolineae bacterium]|nr:translation initiation factor IF-2 [Anaerolineae bacterium]